MIKVGDVCIWQNQVGKWTWLNGLETTILEPLMPRNGTDQYGHTSVGLAWVTDTPSKECPGYTYQAQPGDIRKKFPDADDEDLMREEEKDRELVNQ